MSARHSPTVLALTEAMPAAADPMPFGRTASSTTSTTC